MSSATSSSDVDRLFASVAEHARLDLGTLSRAALQGELSLLGQATSWIAARRAQVLRALADLTPPGSSPEHDAAAASRSSLAKAAGELKRASTLGAVPDLEAALAAGEVSTDHVDKLTGALDRLGDRRDELAAEGPALAALASRTTPEQFARKLNERIARLDEREACERLVRQKRANELRWWTDQATGMLRLSGYLDPESALTFIGRVEAAVDAMFHGGVPPECPEGDAKQNWMRAMALMRLVGGMRSGLFGSGAAPTAGAGDSGGVDGAGCGDGAASEPGAGGSGPGAGGSGGGWSGHSDNGGSHDEPEWATGDDIVTVGDNIDIVVVLDLDTLINGLRERSIIEPGADLDLPVETYRRMACIAGIIPIVLDSDGVALDEGRRTRLATKRQRRALQAMHPTCAIPGCPVHSKHCQPHHVRFWLEHNGPSNLSNFVPLCSRHHHAVHEGGWHLVLHADRSLTITYPDGTIQTTGPPSARRRVA